MQKLDPITEYLRTHNAYAMAKLVHHKCPVGKQEAFLVLSQDLNRELLPVPGTSLLLVSDVDLFHKWQTAYAEIVFREPLRYFALTIFGIAGMEVVGCRDHELVPYTFCPLSKSQNCCGQDQVPDDDDEEEKNEDEDEEEPVVHKEKKQKSQKKKKETVPSCKKLDLNPQSVVVKHVPPHEEADKKTSLVIRKALQGAFVDFDVFHKEKASYRDRACPKLAFPWDSIFPNLDFMKHESSLKYSSRCETYMVDHFNHEWTFIGLQQDFWNRIQAVLVKGN